MTHECGRISITIMNKDRPSPSRHASNQIGRGAPKWNQLAVAAHLRIRAEIVTSGQRQSRQMTHKCIASRLTIKNVSVKTKRKTVRIDSIVIDQTNHQIGRLAGEAN